MEHKKNPQRQNNRSHNNNRNNRNNNNSNKGHNHRPKFLKLNPNFVNNHNRYNNNNNFDRNRQNQENNQISAEFLKPQQENTVLLEGDEDTIRDIKTPAPNTENEPEEPVSWLEKVKNIEDAEKIDYESFQLKQPSNKFLNEQNKTYVFPLGGVNEVGKNAYVIEYNDETLLIDYGIKFSTHDQLGMNGTIANYNYFLDTNREIDSLVITHAHEDHIGGIPFLVDKVKVKKIYAPLLATELIKRRLSEFRGLEYDENNIIPYTDTSLFKTKNFELDFFRVCHSCPDSFGVCVKTPDGNVVSAGDYRIDFGKLTDDTDLHKIVEISKRGVTLFLAESTNSDQPGFSSSEDNIISNIDLLIKKTPHRVFVSAFASNLGRIEKIIANALKVGRKICIVGRSMETNIRTSKKIGYLKVNETDFITPREINDYKDHEVIVILTGSQGEEMAALNLMSEQRYPKLSLKPTDTLILSSNPIPGNFKNVEVLVNKLTKLGIKIHQNNAGFKIHSSGHATKQEQQMMMKLMKPRYIMPIHGETKMLHALKRNCVELGYDPKNIFIMHNGVKLVIENGVITKTNQYIDCSPIFVDRKNASKKGWEIINQRKQLSRYGVFNVIYTIDKAGMNLVSYPVVTTRGCFYAKDSSRLISKIAQVLKADVANVFMGTKDFEVAKDKATEITEKTVKSFTWRNKRKSPVVLSTFFTV